jgi:hypothetical protein
LACNVIHHLDEWSCLAKTSRIDLSARLDPGSLPAKRAGYQELSGSLIGTAKNSSFVATCKHMDNIEAIGDRTVIIEFDDTTLEINQCLQELIVRKGQQLIAKESFPLPKQSEATAWHVANILAGGAPELPSYDHAAMLHVELLKAISPHFRTSLGELEECPIT